MNSEIKFDREQLRRHLSRPGARVHFLGIGGIGMAGLARLLQSKGFRVDGCDSGAPRTLSWLRTWGIPAVTGHDPAHLASCDWAVYSPALQPGHPELAAAESRGIPLYRRGQVLPVLAEQWKTIAVAGTHGKTTTSAMVAHIWRQIRGEISYCIGGELPPDQAPAAVGASEWLVIEADESDGTLAHYAPEAAVITNIEFDHMEHFESPRAMVACFHDFGRQAQRVVYCSDDPEARRLGTALGGISYGLDVPAEYRGEQVELLTGGTNFQVRGIRVFLPVPGRHNVANALAALAVTEMYGIPLLDGAAALGCFALPRRRLELVAEARGIRIIGDYAHHPTEIRALIAAVRQAGARRLWAIFQPHRYSRTLALGPAFPPAFEGVTGLILAPVYAASEPPLPGGTSADLFRHFVNYRRIPVELAGDLAECVEWAVSRWEAGDWILVIGAGDVEDVGPMLKQRLEESYPRQ